jgi:hypothetical protein
MRRLGWFLILLLPSAAVGLVFLIVAEMLWTWVYDHVAIIETAFIIWLHVYVLFALAGFMTLALAIKWSGAVAGRDRGYAAPHEHAARWVQHEQAQSRQDLENALADRTRRAANIGRDSADIARDFSDFLKKRRGG